MCAASACETPQLPHLSIGSYKSVTIALLRTYTHTHQHTGKQSNMATHSPLGRLPRELRLDIFARALTHTNNLRRPYNGSKA